jgi:transposase
MKQSPHDWKEARRLQAWRLQQQGWSQRQIAQALGVSEGAVSQWITRARAGGAGALLHRPPPGAPRRLSAEQLTQLPTLLQRGPEVYGFRGQLWTRGRIAAVIQLIFGVSYHPRHVGRLCQAIRWSPQKPARRARPRDEAAIALWRDETWPAIKKGRRNSNKPSSSSMSPAFIRCRVSSAPMPRLARRLSCGNGAPETIFPPLARFRRRASCTSAARTAP